MKSGTDRNENDSKKGKKQFWETKPVLRNEKMVLKSKTGSEKQKATVQQLKKVLRYVGMRGKKRKITKRRKSLKKPSNQIMNARHGHFGPFLFFLHAYISSDLRTCTQKMFARNISVTLLTKSLSIQIIELLQF